MSGTRTSRRQVLRLAGATLGVGTLAGCSAGGQEGPVRVSMTADFRFAPERVTVDGGTTVRWTNDSDVGHTVTAYGDAIPAGATYFASGGFDAERAARNDVRGGLVAAGETYEHTFETVGTYDYVCVPHEGSRMVGSVVVRR